MDAAYRSKRELSIWNIFLIWFRFSSQIFGLPWRRVYVCGYRGCDKVSTEEWLWVSK